MSKELEVTKNLDEVNEDYLNKFQYQDLEQVLKKIGVPSAFVKGNKKIDIIKEALHQLTFLKSALNKSKEKLVKPTIIEKVKDALGIDKTDVEKVVEKAPVLKDDEKKAGLLKSLANIESNLKNGVEQHRIILLKKREGIKKELDKLA